MKRFLLALVLLACCARESRAPSVARPGFASAVFAGGCFWSMESAFEKVHGVVSVTSGYSGGTIANPSYEQVSYGSTGHYEAVEVQYDPRVISYARLLDAYWHNVDPTNDHGQFCDDGEEYRLAIFVANDAERALAEQSRERIVSEKRIVVAAQIRPRAPFYRAEESHQDFAAKNPVRYEFYRFNCGRDRRLEQLWGKKR